MNDNGGHYDVIAGTRNSGKIMLVSPTRRVCAAQLDRLTPSPLDFCDELPLGLSRLKARLLMPLLVPDGLAGPRLKQTLPLLSAQLPCAALHLGGPIAPACL
jgi:hypothetical protein